MTTVPGPPRSPFGIAQLRAMSADLIGFGQRLQREYGDVVRFQLGPHPCFQVVRPEHVQEVLVTRSRQFRKPARLRQVFGRFEGDGLVVSEGAHWARQRRLVGPTLRRARLAPYGALAVAATEAMCDGWRGEVDVHAEMRRLALSVLTRALFSSDLDARVDELAVAVRTIQGWAARELNRVLPTPRWMPLVFRPRVRRALRLLDEVVWGMIDARVGVREAPDDLLTRLLSATDDDGRPMPRRQARDEVVSLLITGHETLGVALTWAAWLLSGDAGLQARLASASAAEVTAFVRETLRLYPPVFTFAREALEETEVAGVAVPAGAQVFLCPYLTQRDARWWARPDTCDPGRFAEGWEDRQPAGSWFPFGAGPRGCIGRGFAEREATVVLQTLLRRRRLRRLPGQVEPAYEQRLSLHPAGGLRLLSESAGGS